MTINADMGSGMPCRLREKDHCAATFAWCNAFGL